MSEAEKRLRKRKTRITPEWLEERSIPEPNTGCWLWLGAHDQNGYGTATTPSGTRRTHRLMAEFTIGAIPPGNVVMHRCDNPPCINPGHLKIGTVDDNNKDKAAKGRARTAVGEMHGGSILSDDAVRDIRRCATRGESQRSLARRFGVGQTTIGEVIRGESWAHVVDAVQVGAMVAVLQRYLRPEILAAVLHDLGVDLDAKGGAL